MVRCFLTLLLALPLLLPQGVCVCHILAPHHVAASAGGDDTQGQVEHRSHGHHHHGHDPVAHQHESTPGQSIPLGHCPNEPGHDHADACPCVIPDYLARQAPSATVALPLIDWATFAPDALVLPSIAHAPALNPPIPLALSSPPIYLTVRALLI